MKMFEYLASGRAILASDLRVLGEVLSSENAVILPGDDVGAWVGAIRALQEDDQKREALSRSARKTAEQHSWERRAEAILDGLQG
jgi:glycosyltransferase involved in cell wall biosynthesis